MNGDASQSDKRQRAIFEAARLVGIPGEKIKKFLGTLEMCGYDLYPIPGEPPHEFIGDATLDCARCGEDMDHPAHTATRSAGTTRTDYDKAILGHLIVKLRRYSDDAALPKDLQIALSDAAALLESTPSSPERPLGYKLHTYDKPLRVAVWFNEEWQARAFSARLESPSPEAARSPLGGLGDIVAEYDDITNPLDRADPEADFVMRCSDWREIRKALHVPANIDVRGEVCKIISRMLDEPGEGGIYRTTRCYDELEVLIARCALLSPERTSTPAGSDGLVASQAPDGVRFPASDGSNPSGSDPLSSVAPRTDPVGTYDAFTRWLREYARGCRDYYLFQDMLAAYAAGTTLSAILPTLNCTRCGDEWRGQACVADCPLWKMVTSRDK